MNLRTESTMAPRFGKRKAAPALVKKPDWQAIKRLYRAGQLSVAEIARRSTAAGRKISHVGILKRAKRENWERDLAPEVKAEIARRLVSGVTADGASREEIVDEAAKRGVDVITTQRADIAKTRAIEMRLLNQLDEASQDVEQLAELIKSDTTPAEGAKKAEIEELQQRRKRLMALIELPTRASTLKDLTQTQRHRIALERQAYGLNDREELPDTVEDRLRRLEELDA